MDIVDAGLMGVRSVILLLTRPATPLRFTIYPMVHLGEPAFYAEISRRLRGHDLIVAEGIQGADKAVRNLTRAYRFAGGRERLGLATQTREVVEVGVPIVWADMTGEDFRRGWRKVPLAERVVAAGAAPALGMYLRMFGSRETLARYLRVNDDTAIDDWNPNSGIEKLVSDERDVLLLKALGEVYEARRDEPINVAIVYGAGHALPTVRYLMGLGYVARAPEWVTVFNY
jgi:hypothetical protein